MSLNINYPTAHTLAQAARATASSLGSATSKRAPLVFPTLEK